MTGRAPWIAAACLALFALEVLLVTPRANLPGDVATLDLADQVEHDAVVDVIRVLTDLGGWPLTLLAVLATGFVLRSAWLPAAFAVQWILVRLAKDWEARPRPAGRLYELTSLSFPSGHAANSVAFIACAVALVHAGRAGRRLIAAAAALTIFIGLTRMYLQVHYLSDVVAGFALAGAAYCAAFALDSGRRSASMGARP